MAYVTTIERSFGVNKKGIELVEEVRQYEFCDDIWNYILDFTDINIETKIKKLQKDYDNILEPYSDDDSFGVSLEKIKQQNKKDYDKLKDIDKELDILFERLHKRDIIYFNNKHFDTTKFKVRGILKSNSYGKVGRKLCEDSYYKIMEVTKKYIIVREQKDIYRVPYYVSKDIKITNPNYFKKFIYFTVFY